MQRIIVLLVSLFVVINVKAAGSICQQRHCIAVVDAGSTGSRLHIYAYDLDGNENPLKINDLWSKKISPGFASIEPNQETVNNYLANLFAGSPEQDMPVYFYATAGMRLRPQPKQQLYYQSLQQWFSEQTHWQLMASKTISGQEEGALAWLAVNYQLGMLDSTEQSPAGVMDMGGASVQIAFPVQDAQQLNQQDLVEMDVYGRHVTLFIHSFLGLGQIALSQQFLDQEHCFMNGYQLPSGALGKGDATSCQHDISKLINGVHAVDQTIKPAIAKNTAQTWYAIGGVSSLVEEKPFSFENKQFTSKGLLEQGDNEVCHQQWQDLSAEYPSNDYLYGYCLFPAYYYALMVDGYGLNSEQPIHYLPDEKNADWSLGVVLHQH